jgi:hypothetical protein
MNVKLAIAGTAGLTAGVVIVASAFASVPREERRAQWPVLAAAVPVTVAAALLALRHWPALAGGPTGGLRAVGTGTVSSLAEYRLRAA